MKKILLSFALLVTLASCSSGTTVADTAFNLTGIYFGQFQNQSGSRQETLTLNIAEDDTGTIVGNIIFNTDENDPSSCAINSVVSGTTSGFSVQITAEVDTEIIVDADGAETEAVTGEIVYQLTQSNSGQTLTGTYVSTGIEGCSNASGSGTIVLNR